MSKSTIDQSEYEARLQILELGSRYLSAALVSRGQSVEAPKLSGDVLASVEALEKHCAALETKLAALPAVNAADMTPESFASLRSERDQLKAKAEKFESEIAGLKSEIAGMGAKYARELAHKLCNYGISIPGRSVLNGANAQGRKPTPTEKILAAKGVNSLAELEQKGNQKTTH